MVAEGIQQTMNLKDQLVQNGNILNMVQNENNSVQQQLTKMRNLIKLLQQQSVTPSPSPYPPQYYQPAANAMIQQQQTNPAYPYPMYPPMSMRQQQRGSTNNSNISSISINPSPTDTVGHMEVLITLIQAVALQPKVTYLMPPSKT
eukprot:6889266-Ditylum_brightwellii.AAC.1